MNSMIKATSIIFVTVLGILLSMQSIAAPFSVIRIGDVDGFGYDADANFNTLTGDGGLSDRNNNGTLDAGDVLPSLNGGGVVATGNRDDFDNRLNEGITGSTSGFTDNGSTGYLYTDISLSTSYDTSKTNSQVYNANTSTYGAGGVFPGDGNPNTLSDNQPGFVFDFFIADADIVSGSDIFFNMVFGDYDVIPADIDFTFSGSSTSVTVNAQNNGPDDGLIQAAFSILDFDDIFTATTGGWNGYLDVKFDAPNEPYTAFDYVELSLAPIVVDVPEPSIIALMGLGIFGLGLSRRKMKK